MARRWAGPHNKSDTKGGGAAGRGGGTSARALGEAMVGAVMTAASFEARAGCVAAPARSFAAYAFLERLRASGRRDAFKRILAGAGTDLAAMRRRVTRLLRDDLDILEDFHHLTRREPPSLSREGAPIAWVVPATGAELAAYRDCAAAAREWGLPVSLVVNCVCGRTTHANGLRFDYRGSSSPPPRSLRVRDGVTGSWTGASACLGEVLGNYASEGAAALVADRARRRVQPHRRPGPLPRRVGSLPAAATRRTPGMKTCPDCRDLVYAASNECPGCGYDFEGARLAARKAAAPGPAAARLAAAAGPLASPRLRLPTTEPAPGRRGSARRHARPSTTRTTARRQRGDARALLATTDELVKSAGGLLPTARQHELRSGLSRRHPKPMDLSTLRATSPAAPSRALNSFTGRSTSS